MFYVTYAFVIIIMYTLVLTFTAEIPQKLIMGFTATPNPTVNNFQPILSDSTGNFSLSFLRVDQDQLALAIVHVPSGESLWRANSSEFAQWGKHTKVMFNGSLVITDSKTGVFWSTNTNGDHVELSRDTNLHVLKGDSILWQSFDFPSDTLVESQNFTSTMLLVSLNGLYSMRLGSDFIGLYAKFKPVDSGLGQIYFKHRALEAKAEIVPGHGPITVWISSDGFMGMYQNSTVPADVQSFNSYQRFVSGPRRVRIESNGNLKGYYWSGSSWDIDYVAISEPCELPSPCGPYGLCTPGEGCLCLDNQTQAKIGVCHASQPVILVDFCGHKTIKYKEVRRTSVELPYKELMVFTKMSSYEQCEKSCVTNCSCWGALYNNASGFCYVVDYPIQTILGVGDETKIGYFKVLEGSKKKDDRWLGIGIGLLCGAILILLGALALASYKSCRRENRFPGEDGIVSPGPYKDLGSSSFGSIELTNKGLNFMD